MHEDSMKKLQGDCVFWLVLLTGAAQLLLVCGGLPAGMFNFHDLCYVASRLYKMCSVPISGINRHQIHRQQH